jgi:hypothetical protein
MMQIFVSNLPEHKGIPQIAAPDEVVIRMGMMLTRICRYCTATRVPDMNMKGVSRSTV